MVPALFGETEFILFVGERACSGLVNVF